MTTNYPATWTIKQLARRLDRRAGEIKQAIEEGLLEAASVDPEILITSEAVTRWCGDPLEQRHWRVEDGDGRVQIIYTTAPGDAFLEAAGFAELNLSSHTPWTIPSGIDVREASPEEVEEYGSHED